MTKEEMHAAYEEKYKELQAALQGEDIDNIRKLTLEVHAMVHPAEVSGDPEKTLAFGKKINAEALRDYMLAVGKNTRRILESLTLEQIKSMVPEEWVMRILEEGGVTTDFRSVWLLVYWGRLTRGGMILTPMTGHHMMHLPPCLNHLPIMEGDRRDVSGKFQAVKKIFEQQKYRHSQVET